MALSTYSELKSSIADWLLRDDLTSVIPDFIALAEADIARNLRHWRMEVTSTLTVTSGSEDVPTDWLETIALNNDDGAEIRTISASEMAARKADGNTDGSICFYRIAAGQLELYPAPSTSTDLSITYWARPDALSDSNTTNWILSNYPDLILYGSLSHSAPYLNDDARTGTWAALYKNALDGLNAESEKAKFAGPLIQRVK